MKNLKLLISIAIFTLLSFSSITQAEQTSFEDQAAQYEQEINKLKKDLLVKEAEYAGLVRDAKLRETPEGVKSRGNASQCGYRCKLAHRSDHSMWSMCFSACTSR